MHKQQKGSDHMSEKKKEKPTHLTKAGLLQQLKDYNV